MSWTSISWVLPKKIKSLKIERLFGFAKLKDDWDFLLAQCAGEQFKNKSRPVNLKNEVLIVDCLNSVWANEFKLIELRILEGLKKNNGQLKIDKISFIS